MAAEPSFPSLDEIARDPAFPTTIWRLRPHRQGLLPVAADRGGPFNISWEVHGDGPRKLVLIGGLGVTKTDWQRQTLHFGHLSSSKETPEKNLYSVLVLDNRGVGLSDRPLLPSRYATSELAADVLEVADHVGWTGPRQLHVVGGSMGGMIAQEVAWRAPGRIASLVLYGTTARIQLGGSGGGGGSGELAAQDLLGKYYGRSYTNGASASSSSESSSSSSSSWWTSLVSTARTAASLLLPRDDETAIRDVARGCCSDAWLAAPDDVELPPPTSCLLSQDEQQQQQQPPTPLRFPSNYARLAAQELHKLRRAETPYSALMLQACGAATHRKTSAQLRELGDRVGRGRIAVLHGDGDRLMDVAMGRGLIAELGGGGGGGGEGLMMGVVVKGMGHAPIFEGREWFNGVVEEVVRKGEEMNLRRP